MAIHGDVRAVAALASLRDGDIPVELVVVNTGSAGTLRQALGGMLDRIVLVESPTPRLPGGTRNLGLGQATAPVVAFLAADCLAAPGWVSHRLADHRTHEAVASTIRPAPAADGRVRLASWATHMLLHSRRAPEYPPERALRYSVSYRSEVFTRLGTFLEDRLVGEDTEYINRLAPVVPAWNPEIITLHRYPETVSAAIADAFGRGARMQAWMRAHRNMPMLRALRRVAGMLVNATSLLAHAPRERRGTLLAATPLAWCLVAAYGAGVLSQVGRRGTEVRPPESLSSD